MNLREITKIHYKCNRQKKIHVKSLFIIYVNSREITFHKHFQFQNEKCFRLREFT